MNKNTLHIAFSITFLLLISLPLLDIFINLLPENKNTENRPLANFSPEDEDYLNWPKSYENYFKDRFHGRSLLFDVNMKIKRELSSKPFKDNKLLIGKQGWYFSNFQKVVDDYRAVRPFTESELLQIKNSLLRTKDDLSQRGIKYYLLIVPNKHTIYADKLPDYIKKTGKQSRLEQLLPVLKNTEINVVDIRDKMMSSRNVDNLYFKTDSHWNLNGAFIGYSQLLDAINQDFPSVRSYKKNDFNIFEDEKLGGDIVAMMGQSEEIKDTFVHYKPLFESNINEDTLGIYELPKPKIFHPEITVSAFKNSSEKMKLVVFKDSYGGYMQPFLNLHFKRAVYVWGHDYNLNKDIVQKEEPEVVVQIIVERYLYTLLDQSEITSTVN